MRALDAAIAERIGFTIIQNLIGRTDDPWIAFPVGHEAEGRPDYRCPRYSTDPAASHELRTWMRENGWLYEVWSGLPGWNPYGEQVRARVRREGWESIGNGTDANECTALALAFYHAETEKAWEGEDDG